MLPPAVASGADTVITTGGIQSNHCRATAVAARQLGIHPIVLLRGEPSLPTGNVLLNTLWADIHYCSADTYRTRRDEVMQGIAEVHESQGKTVLIVPEGGSNGLGAKPFGWRPTR